MELLQARKVRFSHRTSVLLLEEDNDNCEELTCRQRVDPRKAAREEAYQLNRKGCYGQLLRGSFEDCPTEDEAVQAKINAFVLGVPDTDNARGLERYMSPQHKDERDQAREDVLGAVLTRQEELQNDSIPRGDWPERLRNESRWHTRDSRVFARRMGIADELAVVQEDQPDHCFKVLQRHHQFSQSSACNAKKALRQSSCRQLSRDTVGIRNMAASMNAKKASRQASLRKLNCSIHNLSSCPNNSSHSSLCSSVSSSGSISTAGSTESNSLVCLHPSWIAMNGRQQHNRDQALQLPGRSSTEACADIIQSALDSLDDDKDDDDEEEKSNEETMSGKNNVALSALVDYSNKTHWN